MTIVANGINDAWLNVVRKLQFEGAERAPRGKKSREVVDLSVKITNPKKRILSLPVRRTSLPFAFGELLWYLTGRNDLEMMSYYSKNMKTFSDDGHTLNSAYGYRIFGKHPMLPFNQWDFVINKLQEDPSTRQAIIHLHTPNNKPTKDEVCTLTLQFLIRDGKLDMKVNMRSNDIIWGFTYDVFSFTTFQELIANELNIEVGNYFHNAASMHIYEKDYFYFDYLDKYYDDLMYMTRYDNEFGFEGLLLNDKEWGKIAAYEETLRMDIEMGDLELKHPSLNVMHDIFRIYKVKKDLGKDAIIPCLQYDNLYHCIMRNYMFGNEKGQLTVVEGCDGAGKSTFIEKLTDQYDNHIIHFDKPTKDFDKLIYFQTVLLDCEAVLDRFYQSEVVYSKVYNRSSLLNREDVMRLDGILNKKQADVIFISEDPQICFERLDKHDKEKMSFETIQDICREYRHLFEFSWVERKNKKLLV